MIASHWAAINDQSGYVVPGDLDGAAYVVVASDDSGLADLEIDLGKYPEVQRVLETRELLEIEDAAQHPLLQR